MDKDTVQMMFDGLKGVKQQVDSQNTAFQAVLLKVVENQGATNSLVEGLSKDIRKNDDRTQAYFAKIELNIKENDERIQKDFSSLEGKISDIEEDLNIIKGKAKVRKAALYMVIGGGVFVGGVVKFGNDAYVLVKNLLQIKGL